MVMAIETDRGQASLEHEKVLISSLESFYRSQGKNRTFPKTRRDKYAAIDGMIVEDGVVVGIYESKCRFFNKAALHYQFNDEYLIGNDKIVSGLKMSKDFYVPFYALIYLVYEPVIFIHQISDDSGNAIVEMEVKKTKTQASMNGGVAYRENAFIPIKSALEFPVIL